MSWIETLFRKISWMIGWTDLFARKDTLVMSQIDSRFRLASWFNSNQVESWPCLVGIPLSTDNDIQLLLSLSIWNRNLDQEQSYIVRPGANVMQWLWFSAIDGYDRNSIKTFRHSFFSIHSPTCHCILYSVNRLDTRHSHFQLHSRKFTYLCFSRTLNNSTARSHSQIRLTICKKCWITSRRIFQTIPGATALCDARLQRRALSTCKRPPHGGGGGRD